MSVDQGATAAPGNPYAAPQARVADAASATDQSLYVVAPWKFVLLSIVTFTWYHLYWFYRNWSQLNRRDRDYWPVMRALFAIFFTHSLFERVRQQIRAERIDYHWAAGLMATLYVVAVVASRVIDALARSGVERDWFLWAPMALSFVEVFALYRAQLAINAAERDPRGTTNATLTGANYAWLAVFGLLWVFLLFGLYLMFNPAEIDLSE